MRQTQFIPLRGRGQRAWRLISVCALAIAGWGCQQPPCCFYYGYGAPPCATVVPPAGVQSGTVCEPPVRAIEGTTSSDVGNASASAVNPGNSSGVVVSQPNNTPSWPWRTSSSGDTQATTSIEGAVSDSTVK